MFPPLISPVTLRGTLISYATWGHLALVHEWQRKGGQCWAWAAVVRDAQRGLGLCGEERRRWGPGLDCARQGLAPRCLLSALRPPCSDRNVLLHTQPLCVCCSMERHPRSGDTCLPPTQLATFITRVI